MAGNVREWVWNETTDRLQTRIFSAVHGRIPYTLPATRSSLALRPFRPEWLSCRAVSRFPAAPRWPDRADSPLHATIQTNNRYPTTSFAPTRGSLPSIPNRSIRGWNRSTRARRAGPKKKSASLPTTMENGCPRTCSCRKCSTALSNRRLFSRGRCENRDNDRGSRDRHVRFPDVERPGRSVPVYKGTYDRKAGEGADENA